MWQPFPSTLGGVVLVEREAQQAGLAAALRDAAAGRGALVLVTGEAGAGKTALVRQFGAGAASQGKVLWGMCDELVTPRPLGPFRDMLGQLGTLGDPPAPGMLDALVSQLGSGGAYPTVIVVEDAHWADEATLDAIRFLGRRVGRMPALLVVTFRGDEVPAGHPLRSTLASVPPDDIRRLTLPPLSRPGVAQLAGRADITDLYRLTSGNPFYVTELLAAPDTGVPRGVQDVVLARVGRLSERGRRCVEAAAVVPGRVERWLLEAGGVADGIDAAVGLGILHTDGQLVWFTHEIARRAVEHSLPRDRRRALNGQVLTALSAGNGEPARLAHHAVQADDPQAIAQHAPVAARLAASLSSHQQAVDHYEQALRHPDQFGQAEHGRLLDEYANECYLTGRYDRALPAIQQAIDIHRQCGATKRCGASHRLLSDVHWFLGNGREAEDAATRAVEILADQPPSRTLVSAYAQRAKLAIVDFRGPEAITWGDKAIELARRYDDAAILALAQITGGVARWLLGGEDDALVRQGLELAKANNVSEVTLAGYLYLANVHTNLMQYVEAGRFIEEGLAYYRDNDIVAGSHMLIANRAWWHLEQGQWAEAEQDARQVLDTHHMSRGRALRVLGQIQARRGDPEADHTLAEAHRIAMPKLSRHNVVPPTLARVELAWLRGDLAQATGLAAPLRDRALTADERRWRSEAACWLRRLGLLDEPPDNLLEPYALHAAGQWRQAASWWEARGRPYEQADALGDADEPAALLEALPILDSLGAKPRAAMVRKRLADMGVSSVPRGPRAGTRASPAGLTARQTEVLRLLAGGMTYQEIASRLHLSFKTVDNHVAAVRSKLHASTRAEAVAAARRLGIVGPAA